MEIYKKKRRKMIYMLCFRLFPNEIVTGDRFLSCPYWQMPIQTKIMLQGQCKPRAIELARIAEVQPVLAIFSSKLAIITEKWLPL